MRIVLLSSITAIALLQGCGAHFNSIYRSDEIGDMSVRSVDAKQRLVFAKTTAKGIIVCSEPSPDALSAGGTAVDASADTLGKITGLSLGAASAESAGSIGLRTQTISLLRDQMTQLCLRRMAGSLDEKDYSEELRQLKVSALGMLAIEQLTGAVKAPPIVVNVNAQRSAAADTDTAGSAKGGAAPVNLTLTGSGSVGSTGASSPAPPSDTNNAVLEVLRLVLYEGFNSLECRAAKAAYLAAGEASKDQRVNVVTAVCPPSEVFEGYRLPADIQRVANSLAAGAGNDTSANLSIRANAARAIQRLEGTREDASKPLQGYDVAVFVCRKADAQFVNRAREVVLNNVRPLTAGRVRIEQLGDAAFQKRSGLQLGQKPLAVVFYDGADELQYVNSLIRGLELKVRFGLDVETRENPAGEVGTAYYLSAWLCP